MTDEQKQKRADAARQNGRKSRGPITAAGKHRSSMNAIATGKHVEVRAEEMPEFLALLTVDDRHAYIGLYQKHLRQFQPHSECEQTLVRHLTAELFHFQRLVSLETYMFQGQIDTIWRKYPDLDNVDRAVQAFRAGCLDDKAGKILRQQKKAHLASYQGFLRILTQVRKSFPLVPPEPISVDPDSKLADPIPPSPEAAAEMLALADQAKNEPGFVPPQYVINLLFCQEVMDQIAPGYDFGDLLERFADKRLPEAA